jgi:glycosyltransferase involved in cell wall biosynthesis
VVYPFIDYEKFKNINPEKGDYFLVITRLQSWKKVEIAIQACENLGEKLKIVGEGPDFERLVKFSSQNTEFLGYVSEKEKIEIIRNCKAVIITQKEDFGIVPLEAMACGKPVIAFKSGGATETVLSATTGEFFEEQKSQSLEKILLEFDSNNYDSSVCKSRAGDFDKKIFEEKIRKAVDV